MQREQDFPFQVATDGGGRRESLRSQLLRALLVPVLTVLVLDGVLAYFLVIRPAIGAYDQALGNSAMALSQQVRFEGGRVALHLPAETERLLRTDRFDAIYLGVFDGKERIAGDRGLPPPGPDAVHQRDGLVDYYDALYRGDQIRAASVAVHLEGQEYRAVVAETLKKRHGLLFDILLGIVLPQIMLAALLVPLLGRGVRHGLAPLDRLRSEIQARSPRDLRPLDETLAVAEVRPLVEEMNKLMHRLEVSASAHQRFLANAAHQLRTPLAGLHTQLELALSDSDPVRMRERMAECRHATERTARLVQQLLTLSAAEPGGRPATRVEATDLQTLIAAAANGWVHQADDAGIDLGFELEPAPLNGDALLLGEMVTNLVDNAIRYTGRGGRVTVRCGGGPGPAWLEVEDNGPGIPADARGRVLERFYRLPGTGSVGSGLGLPIVQEIAARHGGRLALRDAAGLRGTLARITFDTHPPAAATPS